MVHVNGLAKSVGVVVAAILLSSCKTATPEAKAPARAAEAVASAHGTVEAEAYRDKTANIDAHTSEIGAGVYEGSCSGCHAAGMNRAPQRFILAQMAPESIHRALTTGVMKEQAAALSDEERAAVAQYLTGRKFGDVAAAKTLMCTGAAAAFDRAEPPVFSGWGLEPGSSHAITGTASGLTRSNVGKLKLKWALAFPNALRARAQPALAGGAIFVGSHDGTVYALDRETGCARWTFSAAAEVRTGLVVSPWKSGDASAQPLVYFGDIIGNVYAVEAFTGKLKWEKMADEHPAVTLTGAPTLHGGILYVPVSSLEEAATDKPEYQCCTFRGSILALNGKTGDDVWRTYLVDAPKLRGKNSANADKFGPSGVPIWSSPAIDEKRGQLYVATGDNYSTPATSYSDAVVAIDLKTGKINWAYQALAEDAWNTSCAEANKANCPEENGPDFDFGAGAVLATGKDGKEYVLAGQKSGEAYAIDADTGKLKWKAQVGRGGVVGGIHFGLAAIDGVAFFPVSDVPDGKKYLIPPNPGIFALDIASGVYAWRAPSTNVCNGKPFCHPGYGGAITATPQLVIAGGNDGYLRIYDSANGKLLWETDTVRAYTSVSGVVGNGGSFGGGTAPIAYAGKLIANSGYGFAGKIPGNMLLVFDIN